MGVLSLAFGVVNMVVFFFGSHDPLNIGAGLFGIAVGLFITLNVLRA